MNKRKLSEQTRSVCSRKRICNTRNRRHKTDKINWKYLEERGFRVQRKKKKQKIRFKSSTLHKKLSLNGESHLIKVKLHNRKLLFSRRLWKLFPKRVWLKIYGYKIAEEKRCGSYFINLNTRGTSEYSKSTITRMNFRNIRKFPNADIFVEGLKNSLSQLLKYCVICDDDAGIRNDGGNASSHIVESKKNPDTINDHENEKIPTTKPADSLYQHSVLEPRLTSTRDKTLEQLSSMNVKIPVVWSTSKSWGKNNMCVLDKSRRLTTYTHGSKPSGILDDVGLIEPKSGYDVDYKPPIHLHPSYDVLMMETCNIKPTLIKLFHFLKYEEETRRGCQSLDDHLIFSYGGLFVTSFDSEDKIIVADMNSSCELSNKIRGDI